MRWSGFLTEYSTFFCFYDKKDRFTEFGKSLSESLLCYKWGIIPHFARNPYT